VYFSGRKLFLGVASLEKAVYVSDRADEDEDKLRMLEIEARHPL
jgi:hypothetical protein